ncbi:MAG: DEAD/DEAH box helicase [Desulfamplus sp.]|nr:DEAD/DEAH box helicase [Desulfamplus sp.]
MDFRLKDKVYMAGLHSVAMSKIKKALALPNLQKIQLLKIGKHCHHLPDSLNFYDEVYSLRGKKTLVVPRGAGEKAYRIAREHHQEKDIVVTDERTASPCPAITFKGKLKPFQEQSIQMMIPKSSGILVFPTGGGKTVAMLSLIAKRGQTTLVIVDKKELLYQWHDRACQFLDISPDEIGMIGAGKFSIGERLTIGTIQTIARHMEELKHKFGQVIVDECHKAAAPMFSEAITQFTAKYIHGCTATPIRNDGKTEALKFYLGDIIYQIDKKELLDSGDLCQARFIQIATPFNSSLDGSTQYTQLMTELVTDSQRNQLICQTIANNRSEGLNLILTGRIDHCDLLQGLLKNNHGLDAHVLTGSLPARERKEVFDNIRAGAVKYIIATTSLLKEGLTYR